MFDMNKFSVLDSSGKVLVVNDKKHVLIKHEATFQLKFHNPYNTRMQIDVYLNGKVGDEKASIGSWILKPGKYATLETNEDNGKLFTFVKLNSPEFFSEIGKHIKDEANWGLISVRFRTEKDYTDNLKRSSLGGGSLSYDAGGIALSGSSDQEFGKTHPILNWGSVDTIYAVRLVEDKIKSLYNRPTPIPEYNYPE